MPEYGFYLTRIFPYKNQNLGFLPYMGKYWSRKIAFCHLLRSECILLCILLSFPNSLWHLNEILSEY